MEVRKYKNTDYYTLSYWWDKHGQNYPELETLPDSGYIVDNIAACFVYKTNSNLAMIEFLISNPESNKEERNQAIDLVIDACINDAKESGYKVIYNVVDLKKPHVVKRFTDRGFETINDNEMKVIARKI